MFVISAEPIIGFGFCSSSPEIVTSFYEIFFRSGRETRAYRCKLNAIVWSVCSYLCALHIEYTMNALQDTNVNIWNSSIFWKTDVNNARGKGIIKNK